MLIILYICSISIAREDCNDATARAVVRQHVETVMGGVPSQYTTLLTGQAGVKDGEYVAGEAPDAVRRSSAGARRHDAAQNLPPPNPRDPGGRSAV
jgi:hypothetical protein